MPHVSPRVVKRYAHPARGYAITPKGTQLIDKQYVGTILMPFDLDPTWAPYQGSDPTDVTGTCTLVKPSKFRTCIADDGVRCALRGRGLQAPTVRAQGHLEASVWLE